jgi:hypothetical protein
MYTHPHIGSQIGTGRQRDRLARAEQQRLARQARHLARARRAQRPQPDTSGALPLAARLRSILSATP